MIDPRVQALCDEFGIKVIPGNRYPEIGETRAPHTVKLIMDRHGEAHARLVMSTLAETANNKALLDEVGLWMTSDLVRHYRRVIEERAGEWLDAWDQMPVGELQFIAQDMRGCVKQRPALAGMVHERLYRLFGPNAAQMDLLDDRRRTA